MGINLCGNILLQKNISLWLFHLDHNLKDNDENVFLISEINRGPQVACSRMNSLNNEDHVCSSSMISWTCKDILWSLFFFMEPCFHVESFFSILKSLFSRESHFVDPKKSLHWRKSPLFIVELKELNFGTLQDLVVWF